MPTKKPLIGAAIVGQSGGPSSVINASAYGVIKTALEDENITKVYGAEHGIVGVLEDRLMIMDEEDPAELISELDGCISRLEYLIAKINICNCNTKTPDGKSITELIAKRDCLKIKIDAYRDLAGNASSLCDRVTRSEIVILSTVDVRALQKQIDAMSRELRCTDNMIQQLNWLTEIE